MLNLSSKFNKLLFIFDFTNFGVLYCLYVKFKRDNLRLILIIVDKNFDKNVPKRQPL